MFPWIVTDFGLIEAIESGLVKIPFLPESDNTHELDGAKLRNLYDHAKKEGLPKKGQKRKKSEAKKEGKAIGVEGTPHLPQIVTLAIDQFYNHYKQYDEGLRQQAEEKSNLFSEPPVFIVVCNNTSVSKEVYKHIAGYELTDSEGSTIRSVEGNYPLFSNYDTATQRPKRKAPTLLIDSDALENSNQINKDFKKVFASEIEEFRKEYARLNGSGSVEKISDAEILREVVNTVGKPGKLGSHVRCVVSVSMLTEGWDANTVTHIMGLRAFGSNLLCEQVAGRALRRKRYNLVPYDPETGEQLPTNTKRTKNVTWKFPPEYAHIIGVPFRMFKGGSPTYVEPPEYTRIYAMPERQAEYEITFPNVTGYRLEHRDGEIQYDFSQLENFEIDGSNLPTETTLESAFSSESKTMKVETILEKRDQEIIFFLSKELLKCQFQDVEGTAPFQRFNQVRKIVEEWYETKIQVLNQGPIYKRLAYFKSKAVCDHIARGINTDMVDKQDFIRPIFKSYGEAINSTKYVTGNTSREVYPTHKSHVNFVVADTDSWEQIAAKTLEELDEVEKYVKNAYLGFAIPYVKEDKDKLYYPDFIACCHTDDGGMINLIIEITGSNKDDKTLKKWFVENRWLPAVNAVRDRYGYNEWHFIEIANDLRDIKNQLISKIKSATLETTVTV